MDEREQKQWKVLDRVQKLIALSSSPNEEEARSAAFQACKLIREYKLEFKKPFEDQDTEASWVRDLRTKQDPSQPIVHLTHDGRSALCRKPLTTGVNYFWMGSFSTMRNVCHACVKEIMGTK